MVAAAFEQAELGRRVDETASARACTALYACFIYTFHDANTFQKLTLRSKIGTLNVHVSDALMCISI